MADPQSFVGTWKGMWDQTQEAKLTVEKVDGSQATVTYRAEPTEHWGVKEPVVHTGVAEIHDGILRLEHATFMFVNESRLDGKLEVGPYTNLGVFTKQ